MEPRSGTRYRAQALTADRTIPPDARRLRDAHLAGLRPSSPWLSRAALLLGLGLGLGALRAALTAPLVHLTAPLVHPPGASTCDALALARDAWAAFLPIAGAVLALALLAALLAALLSGALGPVDRHLRARLRVAAPAAPALALALLALAAAAALALAHRGVLAAAARAADASPTALAALYSAWLERVLLAAGLVLLAAGLAERHLAARARRRDLHQTPAEARQDRPAPRTPR